MTLVSKGECYKRDGTNVNVCCTENIDIVCERKIYEAHHHYARIVILSFYFYIYEHFCSIVKHTIPSFSYDAFSLDYHLISVLFFSADIRFHPYLNFSILQNYKLFRNSFLYYVSVNTAVLDLHRTAQMMQLDIDIHKADNIVGYRIVYIIFLINIMS